MKKRCSKCEEKKEMTEFHKSAGSRDGLQANCKECNIYYNTELKQKKRKTERKYCQEAAAPDKEEIRRELERIKNILDYYGPRRAREALGGLTVKQPKYFKREIRELDNLCNLLIRSKQALEI